MKIKRITYILVATVILAQSCTKAIIDETEVPTNEVVPEEVNYTEHIEPIVSNYCTTCHAGSSPSDGIDLTTYESVRQHSEFGNLIARINDPINPMPTNGMMSESNRELFDYWVNNQFPEN